MSQFVLGGKPEFKTRTDGVIGLKSVYGLTFKGFDPLDESGPITLAALTGGKVQAADVFTTTPQIISDKLVSLTDPKNLFAAQNVIPLVYKPALTPTISSTLNAVDAKLTTSALLGLDVKVIVNKQDYTTAAQQWLHPSGSAEPDRQLTDAPAWPAPSGWPGRVLRATPRSPPAIPRQARCRIVRRSVCIYMKLTVQTFLTLDGVMQAPGGPEEDPSDGLHPRRLAGPVPDPAVGEFITELNSHASAFLLGRRTFDIFRGFWPDQTDPANPIATAINSLPKYVVSNSLTEADATWRGEHPDTARLVTGDVVAAVRALKDDPATSCRSGEAATCSRPCCGTGSSTASGC